MAIDTLEQTGFPAIELLDGEHFLPGSIAQFSFRVIAAEELGGDLALQGEVFDDAVVVHYRDLEVPREDDVDLTWGFDEETARKVVTDNLFNGHPTLF